MANKFMENAKKVTATALVAGAIYMAPTNMLRAESINTVPTVKSLQTQVISLTKENKQLSKENLELGLLAGLWTGIALLKSLPIRKKESQVKDKEKQKC